MIGEPFAVFGTNKVPDPAPVTCPTRAPAPWPPTGTTGEVFFFFFELHLQLSALPSTVLEENDLRILLCEHPSQVPDENSQPYAHRLPVAPRR